MSLTGDEHERERRTRNVSRDRWDIHRRGIKMSIEAVLKTHVTINEYNLPKIGGARKEKIDRYTKEFVNALRDGEIDDAIALQTKINKIKYDTSEFTHAVKVKVEFDTIMGKKKTEYVIKPKGIGFDVWQDGKKRTTGKTYHAAQDYQEAIDILTDKKEMRDKGKILEVTRL